MCLKIGSLSTDINIATRGKQKEKLEEFEQIENYIGFIK